MMKISPNFWKYEKSFVMLFCAKIIVYFDSLVIISTFVNKDFKKSFFIPYPIGNQFGTSRKSCACDGSLDKK